MSRTATLFGLIVLAAVGGLAGVATHPAQSDTRPAAAAFVSSSFRFPQASGSGPATEPNSPIRLTASDGTAAFSSRCSPSPSST